MLRIPARSTRLARFRLTALPTARPATTPTRVFSCPFARATSTINRCEYERPERRALWKSSDRVSRNLRCTRNSRSRHRPAICGAASRGPGHAAASLPARAFDVLIGLGRQPRAAAQAPAPEHGTARSRLHALHEPVHAHSTSDLRLIGSLRHTLRSSLAEHGLIQPMPGNNCTPDRDLRSLPAGGSIFGRFRNPHSLAAGTRLYREGPDSVNLLPGDDACLKVDEGSGSRDLARQAGVNWGRPPSCAACAPGRPGVPATRPASWHPRGWRPQ